MSVTEGQLHHCRHCGGDFPAEKMRRDSSYASGFRPQCLDCKRRKEAKTSPSAGQRAAKAKPRKLTAEERLYSCARCGRKDVPFGEMTKDKRKFMGVGSWCRKCRRERDAELKVVEERRRAEEERQREIDEQQKLAGDDWVFCWKCNAKQRPDGLRQPPAAIAAGYPPEARLCQRCLTRTSERSEIVAAERRRRGLPNDATHKQLESAARVGALRELAQLHESEYRQLFRRHADALGVEQGKRWLTL